MKIIVTDHARFEANRRDISEEFIKSVVESPKQKLPSKKGRVIVQNRYFDEVEGKEMLLRVIGKEYGTEFRVIRFIKHPRLINIGRERTDYESNIRPRD